MAARLFGTDGIRARAGEFPLNKETVAAIGQAVGEILRGTILVGQDTRQSSPWILELLAAGIRKTDAVVEDGGVIPTPAIALLTRENDFAGGVMISASHNPFDDNGIKIFASDGRKLSDQAEAALEARIYELLHANPQAHAVLDGVPSSSISAINATPWPDRYRQLLLSHFESGRWLEGLRIVVDCANGAMSLVAPATLSDLGAEVIVLNAEPTGLNINAGCGAVHLESLAAGMEVHRADLGIAFDGDGDRSLFISASGRQIDGDAILLVMARRLKRQGRLNPAAVVGTQMTNFSLERMLEAEGIRLVRVAVGDRYIFEEMQRSGAMLGGEPSGHVIFSDFRLSGDGLLTTLRLAEAIAGEHASCDDLTADWQPAPQLLKGVRVRERVPLESLPAVQSKIAEIDHELKGRGRLVVRYSGTEPLLRIMIESDDADRNERLMNDVIQTVKEALK